MITIFTDGAASLKHKTAGYGIYSPELNLSISRKVEGSPTNQRAELSAMIFTLEYLNDVRDSREITIYSDSAYTINNMETNMGT